jgi:hypothetical protein
MVIEYDINFTIPSPKKFSSIKISFLKKMNLGDETKLSLFEM